MGTIADELATIPFLRKAAADELLRSAPLWDQVPLGPGEALWDEGAAVDELGVLVVGELVAESEGVEVGRVLPGEICGEASSFFEGQVRSATLRARTAAQVLTLPTASLRTLRWQRSRVYDALLEQALLQLARRVRATDQRIAQVVQGAVAAPARKEPSALARLWRSLRPGGPTGSCPPIEPLLRRMPGLEHVGDDALAALAPAFVAEPVEEGRIVFLEGEAGAAGYLVAAGQVDVLRHVRGDRAELLATLQPGDAFGINTLVERGERTASCVAAAPGWLWRMDADAHAALRGDARLLWRESVLASLGTQLRGANDALRRALRGAGRGRPGEARPGARPSAGDEGFEDLLRASGYLEALPAGEGALERLEVAVDEDAKRSPRRRPR